MQVSSVKEYDNQNYSYKNLNFRNIVRNNISPKILQNDSQKLVILSGPSGVGKDTLIDAFNKIYNYFTKVVSTTTRKPRPNEIDGKNYYFLSIDEFKKGIENGDFIEYANVYADTFYGSRKSDIKKAFEKGKNALFILDVDGAKSFKEKGIEGIYIFMQPQSIDLLKKHLTKRGTETEQTLKNRLDKAGYEIKAGNNPDVYDAVIQNNDRIEENIDDLKTLLGM